MLSDLDKVVYEAVIVVNETVIIADTIVSTSEREASTSFLLENAVRINGIEVPEGRDKNDVEVLVRPF